MVKRVMVLAGGTGGHVFPALAVAQHLLSEGHQVSWIGTQKGIEWRILPNHPDIKTNWLGVTGLRGKGLSQKIKAPWMLLKALFQSVRVLLKEKPNVVLGMGGFVSGPAGLAAWMLRIPLVLHEQNRIPGTTNRMLSRLAVQVMQAFDGTFPNQIKPLTVGNPLRDEIARLSTHNKHYDPGRALRILIVGGSLGAKVLNEIVPEALSKLNFGLEVVHQTGTLMLEETEKRYETFNVSAEVKPFLDDIAKSYLWADIAICRAGAMTVSELAIFGLPALLIPYPFAIDDHQTANAKYLADKGAAYLLPQSEFDSESLASVLRRFVSERDLLAKMSSQARLLANPTSTRTVADICLKKAKKTES